MASIKKRKKNNNRAGKICISMIVLAFVAVMSVQIVKIHQKDQEYLAKQKQLEGELTNEEDRQAELKEYETYTKSQQYIEDLAKSKLGMAYDNEIVFKEED